MLLEEASEEQLIERLASLRRERKKKKQLQELPSHIVCHVLLPFLELKDRCALQVCSLQFLRLAGLMVPKSLFCTETHWQRCTLKINRLVSLNNPLFMNISPKKLKVTGQRSSERSIFLTLVPRYRRLQELELRCCRFQCDQSMWNLPLPSDLKCVTFFRSLAVSDMSLENFRHLRCLEKLSLDWLMVHSADSWTVLQSIPRLRDLSLERTFTHHASANVTDQLEEVVRSAKFLQKLRLSQWTFSVAGMVHVKNMECLQSLSLIYCNLQDAHLKLLSLSPSLKFLDLSWNSQITDTGMQSIDGLFQLRGLVLRGCYLLSGAFLSNDGKACKIRELNVIGCYHFSALVKHTLRESGVSVIDNSSH